MQVHTSVEAVGEEVALVATIMERLLTANGSLRADQLAPLAKRLRIAASSLSSTAQQGKASSALSPLSRNADGMEGTGAGIRQGGLRSPRAKGHGSPPPMRRKARRDRAEPTCGNESGVPRVFISHEVSQAICCSLYNVLEGTTRLLRASHGHIFVKRGEDVFSIANVSRNLAFPPPQVHHGCLGNPDAEVLGSSIALNRHTDEVGRKGAVLIFPIHDRNARDSVGPVPIATIHVERREHVFAPFNESDECTLYFASLFCSELMSRIPQLNFLECFYNPSTQHIVAPFEPYHPVALPPIKRGGGSLPGEREARLPEDVEYSARAVSQVTKKMNAHNTEILIRRESLPATNTKSFAPGVSHMPSLLEIQAYVENLQSCWQKNMSDNVDLLELDRGTQQDLKVARCELAATRRQLATAADKLRLYELDAGDYKLEYGAMKSELNAYMDGLERLH